MSHILVDIAPPPKLFFLNLKTVLVCDIIVGVQESLVSHTLTTNLESLISVIRWQKHFFVLICVLISCKEVPFFFSFIPLSTQFYSELSFFIMYVCIMDRRPLSDKPNSPPQFSQFLFFNCAFCDSCDYIC